MLKSLQIRNFKGWRDTGQIRMAPLTLFFGANSSGKSSISQFLMLLKQTTESPDRRAVFAPGGKQSAVELGSYREMVFGRDPRNRISFSYRWDLQDAMQFKDSISRKSYEAASLEFKATVEAGRERQHNPFVSGFSYKLFKEEGSKASSMSIGMALDKKSDKKPDKKSKDEKPQNEREYQVESKGYDLHRKPGRAWPLREPLRFYGFPDEAVAYHKNADFVLDLNLEHEKLFRLLSYLGPLRTKAERLYSWSGIAPESVGYAGENTIAAILAASERRIALGRLGKSAAEEGVDFQEFIALKLKEMGLIERFEIEPISDHRQYDVRVDTSRASAAGRKNWVNLPDVGFGISQVLPVLTQCFYAPPGSIIIMEQPEIHLHPCAQAALADVMIDAVRSRERRQPRNIQLIIETHSEHFLRRLQRRIAEEKIPEEKVAAYFADASSSPARLDPLEIDPYGNIQNWPKDFFGDGMGDITQQALHALDRQMKQR